MSEPCALLPVLGYVEGPELTTIYDLLAEYERIAPDQRTNGLYFERLTREFLATDPVYSAQYDEVWLWQDWPGRDGKPDTGIDLVARERYTGSARNDRFAKN